MANDDKFLMEYQRDLQIYFGWMSDDIRLKRLIESATIDPIRSKRHHQQIIKMINHSPGVDNEQT